MAEVRGFRALRFDTAVVGGLDNVVTPPFDVISPEEREILAQRSPYNYTHVILPQEGDGLDKYQNASAIFEGWIAGGALKQDDAESFYLLEQHFRSMDGMDCVRRGFFAIAKIPEPGEGTVLGHERTFDWKVKDRLTLTESTRANLGAVFVLYDDPRGRLKSFLAQMDQREPDMTATTIDGVTQRVWHVPYDPMVTEFFHGKRLYIADGHHRYRTAHTYRDRMRLSHRTAELQPWDFVLMGFVALDDPGLFVYPAHRVVDAPDGFDAEAFLKSLEPWFELEPVKSDLHTRVRTEPGCAIGLALSDSRRYLLRLRNIDRIQLLGDEHGPEWRDLDVAVLHGGILERIMNFPRDAVFVYEKDPATAIELVENGSKGLAFILRNMRPEQVCACAEAHEAMPQKATYFFPKLPSGAVIYRLA